MSKSSPTEKNNYKIIVVNSTHWDREWYLHFQQFRRRLVTLMDDLLVLLETKPAFRCFTLDGQTVVMDDYLEVRPENRPRLEKQVRLGRLFVGPWYVLPDEFLVSGEALIRNLLLGNRAADDLGKRMEVGYTPDPFGHVAQLPQILSGFGLKNIIFSRGLDDRGEALNNEFWWQGLDGTRVLAIHQRNSYGNLQKWGLEDGRLNLEKALSQLETQLEQLGPKSATRWVLMECGGDHLPAQKETPEIIEFVNSRLTQGEVIHGSFEQYFAYLLAAHPRLGTLSGELHGARYYPVLPGVYSARLYLKQANERTQTLLEKWAEPLSAVAWLEGKPYEWSLLWQAWKLCLQNHPHDSICGCSVDQVHREMLPRFSQSQQIAELLAQESLDFLAEKIDTRFTGEKGSQVAVVWNPHNWAFTGPVKVRIERKLEKRERPSDYRVVDDEGRPVPAQLRRREIKQYLPEGGSANMRVDSLELHWLAKNLPALGYRTYQILPGEARDFTADLKVGENWGENSLIKIKFRANGSFDLLDKTSGRRYAGLHIFEDSEDAGDEYNYCPARHSRTITSKSAPCRVKLQSVEAVTATFRLEWKLRLPTALAANRRERGSRLSTCTVVSEVSLAANSPRVDVRTWVDNQARDHRLRVLFPSGLKVDRCFTDTAFGVVARSLELPKGEKWPEVPAPTQAQQKFVCVEDEKDGLALLNLGLPEYEVRKTDEGAVICLTLLRCVGWLGRDDLKTRPNVAGPMLPVPEAQCQGKHEFRYSLLPYQGNWQKAQVARWAREFTALPRVTLTDEHEGTLPKSFGYLHLAPAALVISAIKKVERKNTLLVRAYNTTSKAVEGVFTFGHKPVSVRLLDLKEELLEGKPIRPQGNKVKLNFAPFQIRTLEVMF
jgi:mannosylglycerate hydrolase